jgi:hypothetical protein
LLFEHLLWTGGEQDLPAGADRNADCVADCDTDSYADA